MVDKDTAFRKGENVRIIATNKPWVDMSVPPESNDYRNVDLTNIKIYDPCDTLVVDYEMCQVEGKIGWYYYDLQTNQDSRVGLWRTVITFTCNSTTTCSQPTTSTATSSTTGSPGTISSVAIGNFRLLDERLF